MSLLGTCAAALPSMAAAREPDSHAKHSARHAVPCAQLQSASSGCSGLGPGPSADAHAQLVTIILAALGRNVEYMSAVSVQWNTVAKYRELVCSRAVADSVFMPPNLKVVLEFVRSTFSRRATVRHCARSEPSS
jgi:hypothetical protein